MKSVENITMKRQTLDGNFSKLGTVFHLKYSDIVLYGLPNGKIWLIIFLKKKQG